jgi:hypothetical protein
MEVIEAILRFLNSYPVWAKGCVVGGILFSVLVLVFASREDASTQSKKDQSGPTFLKLKGVTLFPEDPSAEVQVLAIVNGISFEHPSVGGVKWMRVGPDMSQKLIELPAAQRYDIRFEMRLRNGTAFSGQGSKHLEAYTIERGAGAQEIRVVTRLPYSNDYKLYDVVGVTRSASVRAVVSYEVTKSP